jgi:hypothetical protein
LRVEYGARRLNEEDEVSAEEAPSENEEQEKQLEKVF